MTTKDDLLWQTAAEGFANSGKVPSLDLHGLTVAEASPILESFLNEQFMAGEEAIKIICGIGTGMLMTGIKVVLDKNKKLGLVEDFIQVKSGGVYVVRLKV
jgi:dsDNA-specific endonuclease/ATPase MutS2